MKMNKANKAAFSKSSLKGLMDTVDRTDQACHSLVVDGGWLLYIHGSRSISGHGKTSLFDKFRAGEIDEHLDVFDP